MYQFSFHEIALFGRFLGSYSPKYVPILPKFSPEIVLEQTKTFFERFEFLWKKKQPKVCTFGPTLTSSFPMKMAEIKQSK